MRVHIIFELSVFRMEYTSDPLSCIASRLSSLSRSMPSLVSSVTEIVSEEGEEFVKKETFGEAEMSVEDGESRTELEDSVNGGDAPESGRSIEIEDIAEIEDSAESSCAGVTSEHFAEGEDSSDCGGAGNEGVEDGGLVAMSGFDRQISDSQSH